MKIEYITDVSDRGDQKFIVCAGGVNKEARQTVDHNARNKEFKALEIGKVKVNKDFSVNIAGYTHIAEIILAVEIAKVIVESIGFKSAFDIQ